LTDEIFITFGKVARFVPRALQPISNYHNRKAKS
jgi:hypothetical protein